MRSAIGYHLPAATGHHPPATSHQAVLKRLLLPAALIALATVQAAAQNPTPPAAATPAAGVGTIRGAVIDSLHDSLLRGALVRIENTVRESFTDSLGAYRIDSIPTGMHRLMVIHPLLDTLGISLVTPPLNIVAGETRIIELAIPSGETLVSLFCPPARRALGPAALVGFVRDADNEGPAQGAKVSLL